MGTTSPPAAATGVNLGTNFTWTAFTGGISLAIFRPTGATPTYWIFTADAQTTIPDLTAEGLGLPTGGGYLWFVYGFAPFASIDAFAAGNNIPLQPALLLPLTSAKVPAGFPVYNMCYTNLGRAFTTQ